MELGLAGKVALVTGSSRGIGASIAEGLAAEGCDVMLTGRDEAALKEVAAAVAKRGRKAQFSTLDLSDAKAPAALVADLKKHFGKLDILVNNAGATKRGDFPRIDRRRLEGRLRAEVLRPRAPRPRGMAAARREQRHGRHHRRHRRQGAGGRVRHRQLRERRLHGLDQGAGRRRQEGRRAGQHGQSRAASRPSGCGGASARA